MKRRNEREFALQALYALEYNKIPVEELLELFNPDQKKYASEFAIKVIKVCHENEEALDNEIQPKLINWDLNRVAMIDRILIRMALVEFLYFNDIPPQVTINEIIEISKSFSTSRSGKFINGILDSILKDLHNRKRLKKSARGLI